MDITIKYFASIAEHAGKTEEKKSIGHNSIPQLFEEIKKAHNFPHTLNDVKVAVNLNYVDINTLLKENDTVAFIPPVAGG